MRVEPFQIEHFDRLQLQPSQAYIRACSTRDDLLRLKNGGPAYTLFEGETPIFCGGACLLDADTDALWSFISADAGRRFVRLTRYVQRFIGTLDAPRIIATCHTGYVPGAQWLALLGFSYCKPLGPFGPENVPHDLWERA